MTEQEKFDAAFGKDILDVSLKLRPLNLDISVEPSYVHVQVQGDGPF